MHHALFGARTRQKGMPALLRRLLQRVHRRRREPPGVVLRATLRLPELVGGQKPDAFNFRQGKQVGREALDRRFAKVLHGPLRLGNAQSQALQPGQQPPFQALLRPAAHHLVQRAFGDTRYLQEPLRFGFQHVEGGRAEHPRDAPGQHLAHAAHARFQVRGHATFGQVGGLGFQHHVQHAVLVAVLAVFLHDDFGPEGVPGFHGGHHADHGGVRVFAFLVFQPGGHDGEARLGPEPYLVHAP